MRPRTFVPLLALVAAAPLAAQGMPAPKPRSPSDTVSRDSTRPRMPRDSTRDSTRRVPPDTGEARVTSYVAPSRTGSWSTLLVHRAR